MSLAKDITVTVTNDTDGTTLTIKSVSLLGPDKIFINGDPSTYAIKEIEEALKAIKDFQGKDAAFKPGEVVFVKDYD